MTVFRIIFITFWATILPTLPCLGQSVVSRTSAQTENTQSEQPEYNIVTVLNSTQGVTITQPEELTRRLERIARPENTHVQGHTLESPDGRIHNGERKSKGVYRIEVFSDNSSQAKSHATARRRNIQSRFPQYPSSLVFESPFWRVNVGAFSSRSEAEAVMAEIGNVFPAYAPYLRIVRN